MLKLPVWLYKNNISKDKNAYYGRIIPNKKLSNSDIAQRIIDDGSEFKFETLLNIINQSDKMKARYLAEGHPISSPFVDAQISLQGNFESKHNDFDPSQHKVICQFKPGKPLKDTLNQLSFDILGVANFSPHIDAISDINGENNINNVLPNSVMHIKGRLLKISGDEPGLGVWFTNIKTQERIKVNQIISNYPKKLTIMVPNLHAGQWQIELISQESRGSRKLKVPRLIRFKQTLRVI